MSIITVQQSQSMNSIAFEHGFAWEALWNLDENAALREARGDGGVLLPGDEVYIPEKEEKQEDRGAEALHSFKLPDIPFRIAITLRRLDAKAIEGVEWKLEINGEETESGKTGSDGRIEAKVPPGARSGELILNGRRIPIKLRHLNPANTLTGMRQRLRNLGYSPGTDSGNLDADDKKSLRLFQADHGIEQTGEMDEETIGKLRAFHEGVELSGAVNEFESAAGGSSLKLTGEDQDDEHQIEEVTAEDEESDDLEDEAEFDRGDEASIGSDAAREMSVKCVQSILTSLEYRPGPIDGIHGPRTAGAVRQFQEDHEAEHELAVTGQADGSTRRALREEIANG